MVKIETHNDFTLHLEQIAVLPVQILERLSLFLGTVFLWVLTASSDFKFILCYYKRVYKHLFRTVQDSVWLLQKIAVLDFVISIKIGTIIYYEVTIS